MKENPELYLGIYAEDSAGFHHVIEDRRNYGIARPLEIVNGQLYHDNSFLALKREQNRDRVSGKLTHPRELWHNHSGRKSARSKWG